MSDCAPLSWLVVNSHPNQERLALEHLHRQSFEPYCPMVGRLVRHARKTEIKARPLFPGYLFVRLDPTNGRWRAILSTIGVRQLVRFGDQLGRLDNGLLEALRQSEVDGLIVTPAARYVPGQAVEIKIPAFAGIVGEILAIDEACRMTVLIEMMQRSVKLQVTAEQVAPAEQR